MPMPTILALTDWKAVYETGLDFDAWTDSSKLEDNKKCIQIILDEQEFQPEVVKFVEGLDRPVHIVAIAEDWCPDVVRHVPLIHKMSLMNSNIRIRYIKREQHPDVLNRFLTVGGEAIPKFIFLSEDFVETGNWGPMPRDCREAIARGKACGDMHKAREIVFELYFEDRMRGVAVSELVHEIDIASNRAFAD